MIQLILQERISKTIVIRKCFSLFCKDESRNASLSKSSTFRARRFKNQTNVCSTRAVDVFLNMQAKLPAVQLAPKAVEIPRTQVRDEVADTPVEVQHQVPMVQKAETTHDASQSQFIDEGFSSLSWRRGRCFWLRKLGTLPRLTECTKRPVSPWSNRQVPETMNEK